MPMVGDGACPDPLGGCLRQRKFHTTHPRSSVTLAGSRFADLQAWGW
jgi:hypothetical protein